MDYANLAFKKIVFKNVISPIMLNNRFHLWWKITNCTSICNGQWSILKEVSQGIPTHTPWFYVSGLPCQFRKALNNFSLEIENLLANWCLTAGDCREGKLSLLFISISLPVLKSWSMSLHYCMYITIKKYAYHSIIKASQRNRYSDIRKQNSI